tara:strand:- start:2522 stop:3136 length:615 start_codon:yes stop_codon:yes gene_type:complete
MKTIRSKSRTKKEKNKTRKKIFSDNDYKSNDGMLTSVWGPSMWHYLHTMSFNYPLKPTCKDKTRYQEFIFSLKYVLPCGKCRKNLCKNLQKLPLNKSALKSRETFSKYIYDLHETINTMLNKNSGLSYDDVRERYEHFRSRCTKSLKEMKRMKKLMKKTLQSKEGEKGCVEPLYGEKSKCVLKVVPQTEKCESLEIDDKCMKQK